MSTHNICFRQEIRKTATFWLKKVPYQELWYSLGLDGIRRNPKKICEKRTIQLKIIYSLFFVLLFF